MKNIKTMTKSMEFCMKFVKNRSKSVISNPDTDLTFLLFSSNPSGAGWPNLLGRVELALALALALATFEAVLDLDAEAALALG